MPMKIFLFILLLTTLGINAAEANESISDSKKAIRNTSPTDGIQLSDKAIKTLELVMNAMTPVSEGFSVPSTAIVHSLDKFGVYRFRKGWFKFIEVKLSEESLGRSKIYSSELTRSDQIVTQGVALLRVTEMEAFGGEE